MDELMQYDYEAAVIRSGNESVTVYNRTAKIVNGIAIAAAVLVALTLVIKAYTGEEEA